MKRYLIAILAAFVVSPFGLWGASGTTNVYVNTGFNTNSPQVDAVSFFNSGEFVTVKGVLDGEDGFNKTSIPYSTHDTLYYTNLYPGVMLGQPGYLFADLTSSGTNEANTFYNTGTIVAVDTQTAPEFPTINGGTFFYTGTGLPLPSQVLIEATNIYNGPNGSISVGNDGLLEMHGKNVTNNDSVLIAGDLTGNDTNDITAVDQSAFVTIKNGTVIGQLFTAPPDLFDLWWGVTNVTANPGLLSLGAVANGNTPLVGVRARAGVGTGFASPSFAGFATYVYAYTVAQTNIYYNIVAVNTNFSSPNISATVRFAAPDGYFLLGDQVTQNPTINDPNGLEAIVQFSETNTDVITGLPSTSSIYFLDGGAYFSNSAALLTNTFYPSGGYSRPNYFAVSRATPSEFSTALPANANYTSAQLSAIFAGTGTNGVYILPTTAGEPYTGAAYGVQVGSDPEVLDGVFPIIEDVLGSSPDIPDPTQIGGRIDLEGAELDLTQSRLRAEGLVTLAATNLAGGKTAAVDWGTSSAYLGATNGVLVVSNVFPQSYTRLRGLVYGVSANWYLSETNLTVTNSLNFHLLVVDQALQGSFSPTVRTLALTGNRSVDVEDPLTVIAQSLFQTTNLTINSTVHLTQSASSFTGTNVPILKILTVNTNGFLDVDNLLDLGLNPAQNQITPQGRQYSISGIGNFGQIAASAPEFQSAVFENDGDIFTENGGSMTIEAQTLDMGLVLTNQANSMLVNGNLILSAVNINATNSTIVTGYNNSSSGGSLTLQTTTDGQITDFVSSEPATQSVINNFWQVTDGFNLPVKPATGDLFGTQITTIATNNTIAEHVWAGRGDYTNIVDGFANNVVIGRLVLSRQSASASFHFSGAGTSNGLYVEYLELDPNSLSFSNYQQGLTIDPNLTIYFADANVNPEKLEAVYPNRLVWVTNFWGPNSTVLVTNELDQSQVCAINAAVADSLDPAVSFFPGTLNAFNQPYPLNNPNAPFNWYYGTNGCPTVQIAAEVPSTTIGQFTNSTFALFKGVYNGLFLPTNNVSPSNSGFFTFNLSANGTFSGRLLMGSATYTFEGAGTNKVNSTDTALVLARHGKDSLAVFLKLQEVNTLSGPTEQVSGMVSNAFWSAPLLGDIKPDWTTKSPSPLAGQYTIVLTNSGTNFGDGYAVATVSKLGIISVAGLLADGSAFSQSVPVSAQGMWPFYAYNSGSHDLVEGWVSFESSFSGWEALQSSDSGAISLIETNVLWSKPASPKARYYPTGFTNLIGLVGSPYQFPGNKSTGLDLGEAVVDLSGGGLEPIATEVVSNGKLAYQNNSLTLSINPKNGTFTGRLLESNGGAFIKLNGVVLQNEDEAFGYFLGINGESGAVLLQSLNQ